MSKAIQQYKDYKKIYVVDEDEGNYKGISSFLAPTGAQGVTLSVCLSVRPASVCLEQSIFIFQGQRAIREQSEST